MILNKKHLSSFFVLSIISLSLYAVVTEGELFTDSYAASVELFITPDEFTEFDTSQTLPSHVTRVDVPVMINPDALSPDVNTITMTMFGESFQINKYQVNQRGPSDYTWIGTVDGYANGDANVFLVVLDGNVVGDLAVDGKYYTIKPESSDNSLHVIYDVDTSKLPPDHSDEYYAEITSQQNIAEQPPYTGVFAASPDKITIDVLVGYT